jgi:NAD(P)-dependent dehydrogenase (short-subunit alcohol dehydrogenase family)
MVPVATPFDAESTAAEVVAGIDLAGRRALITGGASGIGVEIARALTAAGADGTIAVRNLDRGRATATEQRPNGGG